MTSIKTYVLNTKTREGYSHSIDTTVCDEETGATCLDMDEVYRVIGCDCIDITVRYIENKPFDFIVDDCGLLVEDPLVSAVDSHMAPMLAGNLIVCKVDGETGSEIGLTDDEVALLERHTQYAIRSDGHILVLLTGVEYYPEEEEE